MINLIKSAAEAHFRLTKQDIGDFSQIKGRGMHFKTTVYQAEEIGRLCLMEMKAFAGLMRMDTGVFSPVGLDGPIFSFDYIKAFGKETLIAELYDTTISHPAFKELEEVKKKYAYLPAASSIPVSTVSFDAPTTWASSSSGRVFSSSVSVRV